MKMDRAECFISDAVAAAIAKLKDNLTDRFSDFLSKVYQDMKWLNPQNL